MLRFLVYAGALVASGVALVAPTARTTRTSTELKATWLPWPAVASAVGVVATGSTIKAVRSFRRRSAEERRREVAEAVAAARAEAEAAADARLERALALERKSNWAALATARAEAATAQKSALAAAADAQRSAVARAQAAAAVSRNRELAELSSAKSAEALSFEAEVQAERETAEAAAADLQASLSALAQRVEEAEAERDAAQEVADGLEAERESLKDQLWELDAEFEAGTAAMNSKFEADLAARVDAAKRDGREASDAAVKTMKADLERRYAAEREAAQRTFDEAKAKLESDLRAAAAAREAANGALVTERARADAATKELNGVNKSKMRWEALATAAERRINAQRELAARAREIASELAVGDGKNAAAAAAAQPELLQAFAEAASAPLPDTQTWRDDSGDLGGTGPSLLDKRVGQKEEA